MKIITERGKLVQLRKDLGLRSSWHASGIQDAKVQNREGTTGHIHNVVLAKYGAAEMFKKGRASAMGMNTRRDCAANNGRQSLVVVAGRLPTQATLEHGHRQRSILIRQLLLYLSACR